MPSGEKEVLTRIKQIFFSLVVEAALIFEPLFPRAISYYLTQRLKELKKRGVLSEFESKIRRLGKFHYRIEVHLDFSAKQVKYILADLFPNQIRSIRRWINVGR